MPRSIRIRARFIRLCLVALVLAAPAAISAASDAWAQDTGAAAEPSRDLIVGTKTAPPFVLRDDQGEWSGISIELWRRIAEEVGLDYRFEERPLAGLLQGVEDGSLDAAIAAITVTPRREQTIDFSHPFYSTGYAIAVGATEGGASWFAVLKRFVSWEFLQVVGALALVLLAAGLAVWLFERKRNPEQFGGGVVQGIGSAFWWSAVTMTTVGYGDKAPRTLGGRIIGLIWMFAAIIIISSFTASIASSLTVSKLSPVKTVGDLGFVRAATVEGSAAAAFLDQRNIAYSAMPSLQDALQAIVDERIDAVLYDAPILKYLAVQSFDGKVSVLPDTFERQDYGIALPRDSALREPINQALLKVVLGEEWQALVERYLGEGS